MRVMYRIIGIFEKCVTKKISQNSPYRAVIFATFFVILCIVIQSNLQLSQNWAIFHSNTERTALLNNGAEIKPVQVNEKDGKPPSITKLFKRIKATRRRLRKKLDEKDRTHFIP